MEAFGSGGQDAGGGEYEGVLDIGGDEEDAYVEDVGDVFMIAAHVRVCCSISDLNYCVNIESQFLCESDIV